MTRASWFRVGLVILALFIGFLIGQRSVQGYHPDTRRFVPLPTDLAFRSFDPPEPSPSRIAGLHDYAVPVHGPSPSPTLAAEQKPKAVSRRPTERDVGQVRRYRPRGIDRFTGKASWHATGRDGLYAAACAPLRAAIGKGWRGRRVLVAYRMKAIEVTLNDFCASRDKSIDLSDEAFRYFAPLSRGVIRVVIEW